MAIVNQFTDDSIKFLPQIEKIPTSEQVPPLFEGSATYVEVTALHSGCVYSDECDCPITHYDADGEGYCDFHWKDWD